jgi:phosphoglycolate phosphatase-like HAD superfamily hydrolase
MPNLYVWDFHGTLEKGNEHAVREICQAVLEQYGYYRKVTLDEVLYLYGNSWGNYFKALVPSLADETIRQMVESAIQMSQKLTGKYMRPMDHSLDTLLLLKVKGHTNAIVSNCRQHRITAFCESTGVSPLVAAAIGMSGDAVMLEKDVVKTKASYIMKLANGSETSEVSRRGNPKASCGRKFDRVFMIGDKETDIDAGLLAGAQTVLFDRRKTGVETKAHHTISDLREVLKF